MSPLKDYTEKFRLSRTILLKNPIPNNMNSSQTFINKNYTEGNTALENFIDHFWWSIKTTPLNLVPVVIFANHDKGVTDEEAVVIKDWVNNLENVGRDVAISIVPVELVHIPYSGNPRDLRIDMVLKSKNNEQNAERWKGEELPNVKENEPVDDLEDTVKITILEFTKGMYERYGRGFILIDERKVLYIRPNADPSLMTEANKMMLELADFKTTFPSINGTGTILCFVSILKVGHDRILEKVLTAPIDWLDRKNFVV